MTFSYSNNGLSCYIYIHVQHLHALFQVGMRSTECAISMNLHGEHAIPSSGTTPQYTKTLTRTSPRKDFQQRWRDMAK